MIDPKELRIGNLVQTPKWIGVVESPSDGCTWVGDETGHNVFDNDDINPIPITPEWLERLGFAFEDTNSFSEYFNKSFGKTKAYTINNVWFCSHFDWMCHNDSITSQRGWCVGRRNTNNRYKGWNYETSAEVHYIHQLQNLYFALTGQELTIKP